MSREPARHPAVAVDGTVRFAVMETLLCEPAESLADTVAAAVNTQRAGTASEAKTLALPADPKERYHYHLPCLLQYAL
eukprot:COSAG01_NODE_4660_length_4842_cov_22.777567_7_plen_78_part_00